jgi:hypothetical protein
MKVQKGYQDQAIPRELLLWWPYCNSLLYQKKKEKKRAKTPN